MHDGPAGLRKIFAPSRVRSIRSRKSPTGRQSGGCASRSMHRRDSAAGQILDIFEEVNGKTPIGDLRWTIAHIENASAQTLSRMKALGIGWAIQDRLYFEGDVWPKVMGRSASRRRHAEGLKAGVVIAGGTDGPRMSPYNPFVTLEWLVTGRTVRGTSLRSRRLQQRVNRRCVSILRQLRLDGRRRR